MGVRRFAARGRFVTVISWEVRRSGMNCSSSSCGREKWDRSEANLSRR